MLKVYDLSVNQEQFYRDSQMLSDQILAWMNVTYREDIEGLLTLAKSLDIKINRMESTLLLLEFIVYWHSQGNYAMASLRVEELAAKSEGTHIDVYKHQKGRWLTKVMKLGKSENERLPLNAKGINRLYHWLEVSDEFAYSIRWLSLVKRYILGCDAIEDQLLHLTSGFHIFFRMTDKGFHMYMKGFDHLAKHAMEIYENREDILFTGKPLEEHYLNFIGATLLNRAYSADFLAQKEHLLVVPGCMKNDFGHHCQAMKIDGTETCQSCDPHCGVNQLKELARRYACQVIVIEHGSDLYGKGRKQLMKKGIGIIGVACSLQLLEGGWMLKTQGIPSQCMILNWPGCQHHWQGDVTEVYEESFNWIFESSKDYP